MTANAAGSALDREVGDESLQTLPEAARTLKISLAQVYNLIAQGKLRKVKIGKSSRLEPAELKMRRIEKHYPVGRLIFVAGQVELWWDRSELHEPSV